MALTVNTNVASLTAQRQLGGSQSMLATSLERLSSGLRINSAKDDAAGLAISERFSAQIRGLNQGVRNANDGISLVQTAEGALKEVTNNLQRIRELAVQSANATNSASDRTSLQLEVSQLIEEIDRVSSQTKFNGTTLLDGSFTSKAFQVGANAGETVTIASIASAATSAIGSTYSASQTSTQMGLVDTNAIAAGELGINGTNVGASTSDGVSTVGDTYSALAKANAINAISNDTGVVATATTTDTGTALYTGMTAAAAADFTLNGVYISYTETAAANTTMDAAVTAINDATSQTGVTAGLTGAGYLQLTAADGRNITTADIGAQTFLADLGMTAGTSVGSLALESSSEFGIQITDTDTAMTSGVVAAVSALDVRLGATFDATAAQVAATASTGMSGVSVSTVVGASAAITTVDAALSTVNESRANLGAFQNRFQSVVANAQTTSENLSASRSRIVDADFAAETAQMTKAQILQQSGIAMLAQANSIPQNVLALLQ